MQALPSSLTADIDAVIQTYGETVTYRPRDGAEQTLKASVQSAAEAGIIGELQQEGYVVFLSYRDLTTQPLQNDRIIIRGKSRTVAADAWALSAGGTTYAWQVRVLG